MNAATNPCAKCNHATRPLPTDWSALDFFDHMVVEQHAALRASCDAVPDAEKPCLRLAPEKRPVLRTCVIYTKDGIERRTAWFSSRERAKMALAIIQRKYGHGVLFID